MDLLLQGLFLGLTAGSQPGAFQAYLLDRSLRDGWRGTWVSAFAPLLSDGPLVLVVLFLLTRVPDWFARGLRLAGGLFLLYLAWGVLRGFLPGSEAQAAPSAPSAAPLQPRGRNLLQSALVNFLNPAPWIFWSTVAGPAFLQGWYRSPLLGLSFVAGFYGAMITLLLGLVALFSGAGRLDRRATRLIHLLSGLFLAGFGVYQLYGALWGA